MKNLPSNTILQSMSYGIAAVLLFAISYLLLEPQITHSQTFTVSQTITAESSFLVAPTDVTMDGAIAGISGGQATGSTQFVVQTNNAAGYYVELAFFNNGTNEAMIGDLTASEAIRDYGGDVSSEPSRGYTSSSAAQFAYTVVSSTTADTDDSFFHPVGAGVCGTSGVTQADTCWKAPDTTGFRIVERNSSAFDGATSSIIFNVTVPSGPVPVPSAETYTATATLSLFNL